MYFKCAIKYFLSSIFYSILNETVKPNDVKSLREMKILHDVIHKLLIFM